MTGLRQDVAFAARALRRRPAFAAITIATIALGVGAATSIYSVVDGVVLRPPPFHDAGRIIAIWQTFPAWRKNPVLASSWDRINLSIPEYRDLRDRQHSFSDIAIWTTSRGRLLVDNSLMELRALHVSAGMLGVLGVSPLIGRSFRPDEDTPTGPRAAMIGYEMWQAHYGAAGLASHWLTPYLFGVTATDRVTYGGIFALLVVISVGASLVPTRRVRRLALAEVLRAE